MKDSFCCTKTRCRGKHHIYRMYYLNTLSPAGHSHCGLMETDALGLNPKIKSSR